MLRNQRGDRVEHNHVNCTGSDNGVHDLKRFVAGCRLRNVKPVYVYAQSACVLDIERVLGVNEQRQSAAFLCFSNDMKREGRFARALGAVNLGHPSARHASYAQGDIKAYRSRRDSINLLRGRVSQGHDRSLSESLLYVAERHAQCPLLVPCALAQFIHIDG